MPIPLYKSKVKHYSHGVTKDVVLPKILLQEPLDFDMIAERISKSSTASQGDVYLVLEQLEKQLIFALQNAQPVKLGRLGAFYPQITSSCSDSAEEVGVKNVKKFSCIFKPSKYLKQSFEDARYIFVDKAIDNAKLKL